MKNHVSDSKNSQKDGGHLKKNYPFLMKIHLHSKTLAQILSYEKLPNSKERNLTSRIRGRPARVRLNVRRPNDRFAREGNVVGITPIYGYKHTRRRGLAEMKKKNAFVATRALLIHQSAPTEKTNSAFLRPAASIHAFFFARTLFTVEALPFKVNHTA